MTERVSHDCDFANDLHLQKTRVLTNNSISIFLLFYFRSLSLLYSKFSVIFLLTDLESTLTLLVAKAVHFKGLDFGFGYFIKHVFKIYSSVP